MELLTWKFSALKVFVYRNLHQKCWSVKAVSGSNKGRVILHASSVDLHLATFKVSENGRQRVLATKHKTVHAGVEGYLTAAHVKTERYAPDEMTRNPTECTGWGVRADEAKWKGVTYNPYKFDSFVFVDDFTPTGPGKFEVILEDDMTVKSLPLDISLVD